jgi:hypothetical protein
MGTLDCRECKYYFAAKCECRRYPPKLGTNHDCRYPRVIYKDDWCGEFEVKNNENT